MRHPAARHVRNATHLATATAAALILGAAYAAMFSCAGPQSAKHQWADAANALAATTEIATAAAPLLDPEDLTRLDDVLTFANKTLELARAIIDQPDPSEAQLAALRVHLGQLGSLDREARAILATPAPEDPP